MAALETAQKITGNEGASLRDLGDGVIAFEIHRKMNTFAPEVQDVLEEALSLAGGRFRAMVIANGSPQAFSAGADLKFFAGMLERQDVATQEKFIRRGQQLFLAMKYSAVPVVAAVHGFALGGGCEFMLHADAVVAHSEAKIGLPEASVGVIPAWGGCTQILLRAQERGVPAGPFATAATAFELLRGAFVSTSAAEAPARGFLRKSDRIVAHREELLSTTVTHALALADNYAPPPKALVTVAGPSGKSGLMANVPGLAAAGRLTPTDCRLAEELAGIVTGGPEGDPSRPATEEELMRVEFEAAMAMLATRETRERIAYFLATGKPLQN